MISRWAGLLLKAWKSSVTVDLQGMFLCRLRDGNPQSDYGQSAIQAWWTSCHWCIWRKRCELSPFMQYRTFILWLQKQLQILHLKYVIQQTDERWVLLPLLFYADSTVLAYILSELNRRHKYGLDLILLSVDEGITGYRDDSLETVKRNEIQVRPCRDLMKAIIVR